MIECRAREAMPSTASCATIAYFRQFSPTMLSALEFFTDAGQTSSPCMEAIQVLRKMNLEQHGHKKVMLPDDVSVDCIPKRLAPIVMDGGLPSRANRSDTAQKARSAVGLPR